MVSFLLGNNMCATMPSHEAKTYYQLWKTRHCEKWTEQRTLHGRTLLAGPAFIGRTDGHEHLVLMSMPPKTRACLKAPPKVE